MRASHCCGFSCYRACALGHGGSSSYWLTGLVALKWGIFPDQGSTLCPCIGGQIHNHWTSREVSPFLFVTFLLAFLKKYKFIYFNWGLITLQYCIGFAIHQHESATGVPVSFINCWYTTLPHIWCTIEIFPFVIFTFLIAIFSFLLKEVLLTFIIKLVCWSWTSLVFACLKNTLSHLQIWK